MPQETVVVFGSSGFIGTRLTRALVAQGASVRAFDIVPPRYPMPDVNFQKLDVRAPIAPVLGYNASRIYNLAAVHRTPGHPEHEYYDTNVMGALNITDFATQAAIPIIVFASSISVYGPSEKVLTEESELKPASAYGKSKQMAEMIHRRWRAASPANRLITVRPGVVFGPGERGNYTALARALRRGYFFFPGRTDTVKSGGYVDELLDSIAFAQKCKSNEITFNFAYPEESTIGTIVATICSIAGWRSHRPVLPLFPLLSIAVGFELLTKAGLPTKIHRERVQKLNRSTRVKPAWLMDQGYTFGSSLETALRAWAAESEFRFD